MKTISIVLCTYNGAKYIKDQLDSILSQSLLPNEIIIADDCSNDETVIICKNILKNTNIKYSIYVNEHNLGFSQNFWQAMRKAKNDIIFICDQDDIWYSNKLERMILEFDNNKVSLAFHDVKVVDVNRNKLASSFWSVLEFDDEAKNNMPDILLQSNYIQGAACAFRKELIPICGDLPKEVHYDEWIGLVATFCGEIVIVDEILAEYRQSSTNALGIDSLNNISKLNKYILHTRQKLNMRLLELKRSLNKLNAILIRGFSCNSFVIDPSVHYNFLEKRIENIYNCNIHQLILLYMKNRYILKPLRTIVIDIITILINDFKKNKEVK